MYLGIYFSVGAVKRVGIHVIGWLKLFSANDDWKNTTNFHANKKKHL